MSAPGGNPFPNFMEQSARVPRWLWWPLRLVGLGVAVATAWLLWARPELGLAVFWKLLIPPLPLLFAIAPGLWRNVCPMALLNQLPRALHISAARTLSDTGRRIALVFSFVGFFGLVTLRPPLLNHSGMAVATMIVVALLLALIGGFIFKGRSGWCGTFCPLAPIQKVYGHAPLVMVRNGYCDPCVGCQRNCYDFNPRAAVFSDVYDNDAWWVDKRRFFAAALPGLIVGFFNAVSPREAGLSTYYVDVFLPPLLAVGVFQTLHNFVRISAYRLVALFGMGALGIFYWYGVPLFASGLNDVFGVDVPILAVRIAQGLAAAVALAVIARGLRAEYEYKRAQDHTAASVGKGVTALRAAAGRRQGARVLDKASGRHFDVAENQTLLAAIEAAELPIMSGCRMGVCGSDPVVVTSGLDKLEPPGDAELATLRRLGLEGKARLACCCKVAEDVEIDLSADPERVEVVATATSVEPEPGRRVVIVGNGIAGISAAEETRALDSDCRIDLISQEVHPFYNRMGLGKVVYGRAAMEGLYLMKDEWYQQTRIEVWLNTQVVAIDRSDKHVQLGTGEHLAYDTLILATGASAFVPPVPGFDLPGCFALRDAADALAIRAYAQTHACKYALVLGGGVLGVEAADALRQLGIKVLIVELAGRLMERQLDERGAELLERFCAGLGIETRTRSGIEAALGEGQVQQVRLKGGELVTADLLLVCAGIRANTRLALDAGLEVNRGIIVDAHMRTSDPDILAVGDCAELPGAIGGLWAVGSEQGKVAAAVAKMAVDGQESDALYAAGSMPPVQLKMGGIDLKSFGKVQADDSETLIEKEDGDAHRWQTLVIDHEGRIVGGVFINAGVDASAALAASQAGRRLLPAEIFQIQEGDWSGLR